MLARFFVRAALCPVAHKEIVRQALPRA